MMRGSSRREKGGSVQDAAGRKRTVAGGGIGHVVAEEAGDASHHSMDKRVEVVAAAVQCHVRCRHHKRGGFFCSRPLTLPAGGFGCDR